MRIFFLILIGIHAFIHLLGFLKGFGIKEVKELTLPISKPMGMLWLMTTFLFLTYAISYALNHKYAWFFGIIAAVLSQILIVLFWKDAKWGTLPNLAILIVSIFAYGHYHFNQLVQTETLKLFNQSKTSTKRIIIEKDLTKLPQAVQKWMRRSAVVGKPYILIGKVTQEAEMKLKPDQDDWFKAKAVQYSTMDVPAFIWMVDVQMNPFLSFRGRDKFVAGKGEMLIKLNSLINVVNAKGEKIDEGSLQRYLGEMVWFPSLALSPYVNWQEIDDSTAIATMDYQGTKGSGTFYFNSEGDFIKYSALRFKGNETDAKRYEWVLLVDGYKTFEGIKVPSKMTAKWKLESGEWTWLKLKITDIKYNESTSSYYEGSSIKL
ncbi:MAG: DUF6544 family protein [Vicingaceae bacterium]